MRIRLVFVGMLARTWSILGIKLDKERNMCRGEEKILSTDDSKVKVVLVPTDEEIVIARDTQELVKDLKK